MIVGLSGVIGSGKNTVADILVEEFGFVQDSFAKTLKDILSILFGFPRDLLEGNTEEGRRYRETVDPWWAERLGVPNFTPRLAMQFVGTDVLRQHFHPDIWTLVVERRLTVSGQHVVLSDCRFPNERMIVKSLGGVAGAVHRNRPVWYDLALRDDASEAMRRHYPDVHLSEWMWVTMEHDFIINNDKTFSDLRQQVRRLVAQW